MHEGLSRANRIRGGTTEHITQGSYTNHGFWNPPLSWALVGFLAFMWCLENELRSGFTSLHEECHLEVAVALFCPQIVRVPGFGTSLHKVFSVLVFVGSLIFRDLRQQACLPPQSCQHFHTGLAMPSSQLCP